MPSIEKRGDYTYRITVSNGYDRNGKKITEKKTVIINAGLTPKQAEKEIQRLAMEFENIIKKGDIIDSAISFEKFAERWMADYAEKNLEQTTIWDYRKELETKIYPAIGHIKLCDLKPLHLTKFYANLTEDGVRLDGKPGGYSTRVIKYQHQIVSSILQTAVYWQVLSQNIARTVRPPKGVEQRKDENFLDDMQANSFIKYILENEPLEYQTMALVTMTGGLRKGEILALLWADIDFANCAVTINKAYCRANRKEFVKSTKNESSKRTVTLPSDVMDFLLELKIKNNSDRVFPYCYSVPTQWFQRVVKNHNKVQTEPGAMISTDVTFHGLRHTSATLLIAQGLDIKSVSARLGHNNPITTMRIYSHAIKSRDKAAADALGAVLDMKVKR